VVRLEFGWRELPDRRREELCRAMTATAFRALPSEEGEGLPDSRPPRRAFGRAISFCASSYACAVSGSSNDLRLRLPLRSYQSAKYLFPF
jgi:hypothetical protein